MFQQLISNLPYTPSLLGQVSFYAGRLRKEASFRRLGFGCMILAMFIQMVAVISPPERSLAASDNHIINGVKTRDDILRAWDKQGSDIAAIYGYFGVTRADIEKLPQSPNTTVRSNDGTDWWTTGRNSLSGYSDVDKQYKDSELAIKVSNSTTIYMRQLKAWDIRNPFNTYSAWQGTMANGTKFWILQDCGNFTQVGKIPPKTPGLEVRKTLKNNPQTLKPGDEATFALEWRNPVADSLAENVVLKDELDLAHFDIVSPTNLPITGSTLNYPIGNLAYSQTFHSLQIKVKLKNPLSSGTKICNAAKLTASNASEANAGPVCVNVIEECPYDSSIPDSNSPNCVTPTLVCSALDPVVKKGTREVTFTAKAVSSNKSATTIKSYAFDFGDQTKTTVTTGEYSATTTHTYGTGSFTASVVISYSIKGDATTKEASCSSPIDFEVEKEVGQMKKVKNVTQKLEGDAAINSVVKAGDVLEYSLITTNAQRYDKEAYTIEDYVGDILDYADLDTAKLEKDGGSFDKTTKKIIWTNQTIPAFSEVVKTFTVTAKNPIPSTNAPSTVSTTFDCKISNRYGNEIGMQVSCPVVKNIESLPNTGPGTSLIVGFTVTTIIGYFFARSRLLAKEADLIKTEYAAGGV